MKLHLNMFYDFSQSHRVKCHVLNELDEAKDSDKCEDILKNYTLFEDVKTVMKEHLKQEIDKLEFDALMKVHKFLDDETSDVEIVKNNVELLFSKDSKYEVYLWTLSCELEVPEDESQHNVDSAM